MDIGRVVSIEENHKPVEIAQTGREVAIRIDHTAPPPAAASSSSAVLSGVTMPSPVTLDIPAPRQYGRHFTEQDLLLSKVFHIHIILLLIHVRVQYSYTPYVCNIAFMFFSFVNFKHYLYSQFDKLSHFLL